jgi:acyl-homoserine lactone acylase PvdQ
VVLLQRFADGVNAYATDLQAGRWRLDPEIAITFAASTFAPWSPIDSLVLARFQAFSLSWSAQDELTFTDLYQKLRSTFDAATPADPAAYARRGISRDLLRFAPIG